MGEACFRHGRVEKVRVCVCVCMYVCVCVYIYIYIYIYHHASFHRPYYDRSIAFYMYIYIYIYIYIDTHTHTLTKRTPLSRYGIFGLRIELGNSWTRNRRINSASSNVCVCFFFLSVSFVCLFLCFFLISFRKST